MAGCCVVLLMLLLIPLLIVCLVIFLGLLGGAIAVFVETLVLFIYFTTTGFFEKYCYSEVRWQRVLTKILRVFLIIAMVISVIMAVAGIVLLVKMRSGV